LFDQALAAVPAIGDPASRARALAALAPHLPADQRGPVLAQALTAASLASRRAVLAVLPTVLTLAADSVVVGQTAASSLLHVQRWWP
jgi:hypothetical protein